MAGAGAQANIQLPMAAIEAFCRKNRIRRLSLFGSVLRDELSPDSDIDVLIEFEPGHAVDFFDFMELQFQLSEIFGRDVDLNTPGILSRYFRQQVMDTAQVVYEQAG